MNKKFSALLGQSATWQILFNEQIYKAYDIHEIIFANLEKWDYQKLNSPEAGYVLAIGDNSFHYLLYIFLASILGIRIILINSKHLQYFENPDNCLNIKYIISTRKTLSTNKEVLHFETNIKLTRDPVFNRPPINNLEQAEIIFCTSGTTDNFKLVKYYEHNLYINAEMVANYMEFSTHDRCLCMFPLNYMYGFSVTMSMLIKNGFLILEQSAISPQAIVEYLYDERITVLPLIGSIVDNLMPHINNNMFFPNLKVLNASDKITVEQVKKIFKFAPIFWNNMGQTESGPRLFAIKIMKHEENKLKKYSHDNIIALGYPAHKDIKIAIRDEKNIECKDGEIGELNYKTPFAMEGYLNYKNINKGDWISSGDLAFKAKNGLVFFVGRKSQSIKINGTFVNVNLLHFYFKRVSFIKECFFMVDKNNKICGFFNVDFTFVQDENAAVNLIQEHYKEKFKLYPRISKLSFIKELPKTDSGKIQLKALQELAITFN